MEQKRCEESMQSVLDFKCKKVLHTGEKSSGLSSLPEQNEKILENQDLVNNIASRTPARTIPPSRRDPPKDEAFELLDKYKTMTEFFDRMSSSLRLLSLRKMLPTFQNICTQVEILTKRQFSYSHLAQIKYILPEAIQIETILVHDEKTLCMKADMKITLVFDSIKTLPDQSAYTALHKVFCARLFDFFDSQPEGCDIPEAVLPEPFNERKNTIIPEPLPIRSPKKSDPSFVDLELLSNSSHLSPSFSKRFSQKIINPEAEKTQLISSPVPLLSISSGGETNRYSESVQEKESSSLAFKPTSTKSPADLIFSPLCSINSNSCESPFVKLNSVADNLTVETPVQQTPKRLIPSSDDKICTEAGETKTSSHSAAKRSLNFLTLNDDVSDSSFMMGESKQCEIVNNTSPQSAVIKRILVEEDAIKFPAFLQKEKEIKGHIVTDHKMSQSSLKHQQMLASLPDLVNLIHIIFQSSSYSPITKQELVHKIISNNCDITERGEVEEQLELLEKLVPDWICGKLVPSGDVFYSIRKVSDLESICARLVEVL